MIEEFKNTSKVSANPKKIKKKASEIKKFIKKEKNKINKGNPFSPNKNFKE